MESGTREIGRMVTAGCHCRHQELLVSWAKQCIGRLQIYFGVEPTGYTDELVATDIK